MDAAARRAFDDRTPDRIEADPLPPPAVGPEPFAAEHLERLLQAGRAPSLGRDPALLRLAASADPAVRRALSAALAAQGLDRATCDMLRSSAAVIALLRPAGWRREGSPDTLAGVASRIRRVAASTGLTASLVALPEDGPVLPGALAVGPGERAELLIAVGGGGMTGGEGRQGASAAARAGAAGTPPPGLLMSFLDIAEAAAGAEDIDRLLETIAGVLGRLFPVEGAFLALREDGGIVVRGIRPGGERDGAESRWLRDQPSHLFGWVIARDRSLWRNDIGAELRFAESTPGDGMLSDMVIPLRARGRLIGAFRISCRTRHAYDPEDLQILERCADLTAVAVENQRLLQRTRRLSEIDGLTGVTNHRHFVELLRQEVERARRAARPLSLVLADIDDFKSINDTHGHPAGDAVLRHVAQVLAGLLRRTDVVARYGGEEFVAMLPEAGPEAAATIAEKMRAEVERRACASTALEHPLAVRISLGVASLPDDADTVAALIAAADRGLYRAKREGKNRVRGASLEPSRRPPQAGPPS